MKKQLFHFTGETNFYSGKVRDVYTINNKLIVMIASNRISAFDVILPKPIPYKGQVLNQIAAYMLDATKDICASEKNVNLLKLKWLYVVTLLAMHGELIIVVKEFYAVLK
jgi:phosphoribosylaminoimidazole-succinocarboxamide synthase